jgi:S-adenosylmethionine/arginine decarboxylase-like enzyme
MEYQPVVDEAKDQAQTITADEPKTLQEAMTEQAPPPCPPDPQVAYPRPPEKVAPAKPKRPRGRPRKIPPNWTPEGPPNTPDPPPQDYGQELILDIHEADPATFTRPGIEAYMVGLCDIMLKMEREDLHFWDYEDEPQLKAKQPAHLKGISAVQFIKTSNITIHTLDDLKKVFVNIFSCKKFNPDDAERFTVEYFHGKTAQRVHTVRK